MAFDKSKNWILALQKVCDPFWGKTVNKISLGIIKIVILCETLREKLSERMYSYCKDIQIFCREWKTHGYLVRKNPLNSLS